MKGKEEEAEKYKDYFDFSSALAKCPSHRLLAIRRAEAEGFLRVSISVDDERSLDQLVPMYAINDTEAADHVEDAVVDGYKRLLKPSIETEFANLSKEKGTNQVLKCLPII